MANHIRKIDHKGDLYYSLDDILDLLKNVQGIEELKSILVSDNEANPKSNLSDFNQKLMKGLNFNPKDDKKHFEMREFPVVAILNDGTRTEDKNHHVINRHHLNILRCQTYLNKFDEDDITIYVDEENDLVYCSVNGQKRIFN